MSERRLTVLQLLPALDNGGVERGTLEVAGELVRRGHRSLVISSGGRLVEPLLAAGSEHITWPIHRKSPWSLRWVSSLRRFFQEERVDIVHARSRIPAWIGRLAWRGTPEPVRPHFITTAHGLYSVNAYSAVMTRGERVIAISETVRDYLHQNYPKLAADRVRLIYRGVDPQEFPHGYQAPAEWRERWFREHPQLTDRPVITLPGRLTRYKGHPDFIELVDRLRRRVPDVQALIVGGEDPNRRRYADEVRRLVRDRRLDNVLFTGHRSDIREIYTVSNAVVSVSSNPPEAFGRTALEALSVGTPVVGYGHSGVGEILRHLFPFGCVAPGDLDAMADRLGRLLEHPTPIAVNDRFTLGRMLDETLSLYQEVAA